MIGIIVAYDKNRLIGKDGSMPWHIPGELQRFRRLTENNVVIMGRKTYQSLGRPLPGRINIVISRNRNFDGENCHTATGLEQAIQLAQTNWPDKNIYIGGGQQIYRQALDMADVLYVTEIHRKFDGDTYFPQFDENLYEKEINGTFHSNVEYTYVTYRRK